MTDPTTMFDIDGSTLFLGLTGSHAYGMARPDSDVDIRGVCLPPRRIRESHYYRFDQWTPEEQTGSWGPRSQIAIDKLSEHPTAGECYRLTDRKADLVIYSLHKFVSLCAVNNPSFLEILFLPEDAVLFAAPQWETLREQRQLFLTKEARHRYVGYAMGQLKRIQTHRNWLLHPPKKPPSREEFGLPEESVLPADVRNQIDEAVSKIIRDWGVEDGLENYLDGSVQDVLRDRMTQFQAATLRCEDTVFDERVYTLAGASIGLSKEVLYVIKQERKYRSARKNWQQYQKWQTERNEARAELEAKYGFDTKHASHLIRLLRTGLELMTENRLQVFRGDAEELMAIRRGSMTFDELMETANGLQGQIRVSAKGNTFPTEPDRDAIDNLLFSILD